MTNEQRNIIRRTITQANMVLHLDSSEEIGIWLAHEHDEFRQLYLRLTRFVSDTHELDICHDRMNTLAIGMKVTRAEMFLIFFAEHGE